MPTRPQLLQGCNLIRHLKVPQIPRITGDSGVLRTVELFSPLLFELHVLEWQKVIKFVL
jgi:hypothetical protein